MREVRLLRVALLARHGDLRGKVGRAEWSATPRGRPAGSAGQRPRDSAIRRNLPPLLRPAALASNARPCR